MRPDEEKALENITSTFGRDIWKNVVVALTFANKVEPVDPNEDEDTYFKKRLRDRRAALYHRFSRLHIGSDEVKLLKNRMYPTGSARVLRLPGMQEDWREDFWQGCLEACHPEGQGALLKFMSALLSTKTLYKIGVAVGGVAAAAIVILSKLR